MIVFEGRGFGIQPFLDLLSVAAINWCVVLSLGVISDHPSIIHVRYRNTGTKIFLIIKYGSRLREVAPKFSTPLPYPLLP